MFFIIYMQELKRLGKKIPTVVKGRFFGSVKNIFDGASRLFENYSAV